MKPPTNLQNHFYLNFTPLFFVILITNEHMPHIAEWPYKINKTILELANM